MDQDKNERLKEALEDFKSKDNLKLREAVVDALENSQSREFPPLAA
tara:strand:+ start:345 stop:482 length:138 start_codon:yes stop_codon:yes gene_type:complete